MEATPKVTILVPTYNRAHLLRPCLESIARQTFSDFEILVIDDGSTDNTREVLEGFWPWPRYFWQENQGVPGALNRGIQKARGEYIRFLASDDVALGDSLELQVKLLDENPGVGLVYGQAQQMDERGEVLRLVRPNFAQGSYIRNGREEIRDLLLSNHIVCSTVMVRRRCFDEVGLFDPRFTIYEDWDMWTRIAKNYDVAYIDKPLGLYVIHSGPASNIFFKADPATVDRTRRLQLEKVFRDPELGQLYLSLKGQAFWRHHYTVAMRAYGAQEMALARWHALKALQAQPQDLFHRQGLATIWLLAKTLIPGPVLAQLRSTMSSLKRLSRSVLSTGATVTSPGGLQPPPSTTR